MVLKPYRNRGVTLLELLVSIALSGVVITLAMSFWKDAGHAIHLNRGKRDAQFQSQMLFYALKENLLAGMGVIYLSPQKLVLVNGYHHRMEYVWQDSTLTVNGKKLSTPVKLFSVIAKGPVHPLASGSDHILIANWDLDSLDNNADGLVDQEELDRDRNGNLDGKETRFVANYELTFVYSHENLIDTLKAVIHPRNHVNSQLLKDSIATEDFNFNTAF